MISLRGITKRYGARTALWNVDLTVRAGDRVALVGPNGSGKTTLLRAVLGLVACEGEVRVGGHDPVEDHAASQALAAYVPQRAPALPVPVAELVAFWVTERGGDRERLEATAAALGLQLGPIRSLLFPALSGGMQQKLLAAMALATDCPILLLDEPTANLDPAARAAFFALLAARPQAPTVLLSSHRLEELRHLVDRVVVLEDGAITFDDPLDAFLADPKLARAAGLETPRSDTISFRRTR